MTELETKRLTFRRWTPNDAEDLFAIYGDQETMRYIGPGNVSASAEVHREDKSAVYDAHEVYGGFVLAAILRETGRPIGTALLKRIPLSEGEIGGPDVEIGWHLNRAYWNQGLGTEMAEMLLREGLSRFGRVVAVAYPENAASLRVMEKIGLEPVGLTRRYYNMEVMMFQSGPAAPAAETR
jgi:RimJ/RimL family protein N-acetyltransferase